MSLSFACKPSSAKGSHVRARSIEDLYERTGAQQLACRLRSRVTGELLGSLAQARRPWYSPAPGSSFFLGGLPPLAWQPCLRCDQRFNGPALNAYCSVYVGEDAESYRFVVCEPCLDELLDVWRRRALFRSAEGEWEFHDPTDEPIRRITHTEGPQRPSTRQNGSGAIGRLPKGSAHAQRDR